MGNVALTDRQLTTAQRDALVMAPAGTPGLASIGIPDADFADLEHLGPKAREAAARKWAEHHSVAAVGFWREFTTSIERLPSEDRKVLLRALLGAEDGNH